LNENGRVILTERIDRMLELDVKLGILRAEAGVTLADIPAGDRQAGLVPAGDAGHKICFAGRLRRGGRARQKPSS